MEVWKVVKATKEKNAIDDLCKARKVYFCILVGNTFMEINSHIPGQRTEWKGPTDISDKVCTCVSWSPLRILNRQNPQPTITWSLTFHVLGPRTSDWLRLHRLINPQALKGLNQWTCCKAIVCYPLCGSIDKPYCCT